MTTRIPAVLAVCVLTLALIGTSGSPAIATQDSPVVAGKLNTQDTGTGLQETSIYTGTCPVDGLAGLTGCGQEGLYGDGTITGVLAHGQTGVRATGTDLGLNAYGQTAGVYAHGPYRGVWGESNAGCGICGNGGTGWGVVGATGVDSLKMRKGSTGGVAGRSGDGVGVFGSSNSGVGVWARAGFGTGAVALKVSGVAQFNQSGLATIPAGHSSKLISNVAVSSASMVLATPQKSASGVYVQAAVPNASAHTVKIILNKAVPASYPVAWLVVSAP